MSRRGYRGARNGSAERENASRFIPSVPSYWRRGISSSKIPKIPIQNVKTAVVDHNARETPMQTAPFTPARSFHDPSAPTSTRKISASFSTDCSLSGHPTIAYSSVTASTTMNHPGPLTSHPINRSSALPSPRFRQNMDSFANDRALKTSHTCSNLPTPIAQCKAPSSIPSTPRTCINTRALSRRNEENIPPSFSMTSITTTKQSTSEFPTPRLIPKPTSPKKKTRLRPPIPKSRTLNVFSNLTASLSRTSLGQLTGSESRRTSTSSKGTIRKDKKIPYLNPQSASSTSSQALLSPWVETVSQRQIHTAQSSAYWAGRFMALQDRFQSETLIPENMKMLVDAHAERSLIPVMAQPSLASSATMSCITTPTVKSMHSTTTVLSTNSPGKPQRLQKPKPKSRTGTVASKISSSNNGFVPTQTSNDISTLLIDEDVRTRRIFMHLDALCATKEARFSLHNWQQCYARRMGKENLMPDGNASQKRTRELTWVGRLLIGTGGGHSKKSGFGR
ncbi:hypothetical protein F4860DRAFT_521465 [Xylaria cubensis]|nr:hypothetical protein F4860DRAFT_521465 [Xylaria cubensis]